MDKKELIEKIVEKKEFSQLPATDVEIALSHFEKRQTGDEEKIRLTRELLHKVFSSFTSRKLLSPKNKTEEWILRKHLSTRERLPHYKEVYSRILKGFGKNISIVDLGAGINGFSYGYFKELGKNTEYFAVESVGQLAELMNEYFKKQKIKGKAINMSLFDIEEIKEIISRVNKPRIVFMFKVIDSLEMLQKDYSLRLIKEIMPFADMVAVSFPVESMISRKKFKVSRKWITDFIKDNFKINEDFEIGGERYICFGK